MLGEPGPPLTTNDQVLEVDVMRFVAIVGFCLLAVFSLVSLAPRADKEEKSDRPDAAQEPVARTESASPGDAPLQLPEVEAAPTKVERPPRQEDSHLQFADDSALQRQLDGGGIRVFAATETGVLELSPVRAHPVEALPGRVYLLTADSVPRRLKNRLRDLQVKRWLVWLNPALERRIASLRAQGESTVIIHEDGSARAAEASSMPD